MKKYLGGRCLLGTQEYMDRSSFSKFRCHRIVSNSREVAQRVKCLRNFEMLNTAAFARGFGTVLCRTVPFYVFTNEKLKTTAFLSTFSPFIKSKKILEQVFPPHTCSSKPYPQFFSRANFSVLSAIVSRISSCLVSKRT